MGETIRIKVPNVKPFAAYGQYETFEGKECIAAAEAVYARMWETAKQLCEAVKVPLASVKMIVKLLECERIREKDLDIPHSGEELPAMSVGWRVSVTPEQEYALGDRFEEYKLQSAKVFEEEE